MHEFNTGSARSDRSVGGYARGPFGLRVGAAFLGVVLLAGCGQGQAEEASRVSVAEVIRQDLALTAEATGQLEPLRKVEIKSRASGEVIDVAVDTGDRVEPGTLLVLVDPRDVQNEFNQAEADYEVALERYQNAQSQLTRSQNLLAAQVITEQEHESRSLDYANARSQLIRAETTLNLARVRLEDVEIRSRMHGTVLERLVEEGQVITSASGSVSDGTLLLTVANLDVMRVRTLVDETDVGRIQAGMPVTVVVDAYSDRTFQGQVEKIEPQAVVQSNVVMYPVIVNLDNDEGILRPGMSAEVTVLLAERPGALTLPNNAVVTFQEMAAAAGVLGVPEANITVERSDFQQLRTSLRGAGQTEGSTAEAAESEGADGERMEAVRQAMASGDREALRQMMASGELPGPGARAGMQRGARGGDNNIREAVVFVVGEGGQLRPRAVLVGVNDWNNSEILAGLEEGEQVALIGGAQLQAQQQAMSQNMRARMGGMPFGR
jgi:HlyD family secretion protein